MSKVEMMIREGIPNDNGFVYPKGTLESLVQQINNGKIPIVTELDMFGEYTITSIIGTISNAEIQDGKILVDTKCRYSFMSDILEQNLFVLNSCVHATTGITRPDGTNEIIPPVILKRVSFFAREPAVPKK